MPSGGYRGITYIEKPNSITLTSGSQVVSCQRWNSTSLFNKSS